MTILLTNDAGEFDLTGLLLQLTWSGEYRQGARKLSFSVASTDAPDLTPGGLVRLFEGEDLLFSGIIVTRRRDTGSDAVEVTAWDRGFYLLKNQGVCQFRGQTADRIARQLCGEHGITAGKLAPGTVPVSRNFIGVSLYKIIMTAYTEQAKADGRAYQIRFRGDEMEVCAVDISDETVLLEGESNLQAASMQDSIENTVTGAVISDSGGKVIRVLRDPEREALYGVIRRTVRQQDGKDASAEAEKMLRENGLSQSVTAEVLGDVRCITGSTVSLREPVTGLYGLFWIKADKHVWKGGQHYMELTLSFERLMDEQEAGSLPKASAKASQKVPFDMAQYTTQYESFGGTP